MSGPPPGAADPEGPLGTGGASSPAAGYLEVVAAGALWGSAGPMSVALFRMGLPPTSVAVWRLVLGVASLALVILALAPDRLRVDRRAFLFMLVPGGAVTALFHLGYQLSTEAIGVPSTVALLYLAPAMVVVGAGPILGEWPTGRRLLLAGVSVVGVWMTVLGAEGAAFRTQPRGVVWGVLTGAGFAGYTLFARHFSPRHGALPTLLYSSVGAGLVLGGAYALLGWEVELPSGSSAWGTAVAFGVLTITVASVLYFHALGTIDASRAAIGATVEPLVATLLALTFLDQGLTATGWIGLLVLMGGVVGAYAAPTVKRTEAET